MKKMDFNESLEENLEIDSLEKKIKEQNKICRYKKTFVFGLYTAFFLSLFIALPLGMELFLAETLYTVFGGAFSYFVERSWSSNNRLQLEQLTCQKNEQQRKLTTFVKELSTVSHLKLSLENLKNITVVKQPFSLADSAVHGIKLYSIPLSTRQPLHLLQANVSTFSDWEENDCFDTLWLEEKDSVESGIQYLLRQHKVKEGPLFEKAAMIHWDRISTEKTISKQFKKRKKVSLF